MMKKTIAPLLLLPLAIACDESKYDKYKTPEASASVAVALPTTTAAPSVSAAAVTWKKKSATDCKPHAVDFGDDAALEAEVRRKLGKDAGAVTEHDLGTIRSINLSTSKTIHQIDPCIFPMFTSLKDLFLGPGDYDDLTPLAKLSTIESLRLSLSSVKDLHAIEGLKRMDRLDLAHTLVGDEELKSVGGLV
ncbi:MAG TPA: leucine-rich repeat domain-containing protein, partial [Polyangiaceae bacterium]